jgi:NAD(P)-dependent dehydrogenase (short-subunit alcohol dehydrogenase family)
MRLKDQVAIITGGGQGIGREISIRLAEEGANVIIADINKEESEQTAETIADMKKNSVSFIYTDISSEESVKNMVLQAKKIKGGIDILVNNSGIMGPVKNIEDITLEEWNATMAVNLVGMFLCCKHVVPIMKDNKSGSIVNVSSITGKRSLSQRVPYATSKMGVIGLTRTLAAEIGPWKIRVNAVCPGAITGDRQRRVFEGVMKFTGQTYEEVVGDKTKSSPLRTLIHPKSVAGLIAFLCSEDAAMMTGQDINMSAGVVMY